LSFNVLKLLPDAPHSCKVVAASVHCLRLSKCRKKWGAWKEVYDIVCTNLAEKTSQDVLSSEWDVWETTL
jgi:hypothetical protein